MKQSGPKEWFGIEPSSPNTKWKNTMSPRKKAHAHSDALGLTKRVSVNSLLKMPLPTYTEKTSPSRVILKEIESKRRKRLLKTMNDHLGLNKCIFEPKSPRQTSLPPVQKQTSNENDNERYDHQSPIEIITDRSLPLHPLIGRLDEQVDAIPQIGSNQNCVTQLFMEEWLRAFLQEAHQYKSIAIHAEVGFKELDRMTANLPSPNEISSIFCYRMLEYLASHFGAYSPLINILNKEIHQAIYSPPNGLSKFAIPYFSLVKNQQMLVQTLQKQKKDKQEINDYLKLELNEAQCVFHTFLDECTKSSLHVMFRRWYAVCITQKKKTKKYLDRFSMWFSGSPKALVPKCFLAWKDESIHSKLVRLQQKLLNETDKLNLLQKHVEELSVQRDTAQLESLEIRNDRKQAEDNIAKLKRKLKSASLYLEGSPRRESIVCLEAQLRMEALSLVPPLVLDLILRGFHNVGFLQQLHGEFIPRGSFNLKESLLQQTLTQIINFNTPSSDQTSGTSCIREFSFFFKQMRDVVEASTSFLIFVNKRVNKEFNTTGTQNDENENNILVVPKPPPNIQRRQSLIKRDPQERQLVTELVQTYENVMKDIRIQDEHYALHAKLFSTRMLDHHEVSIVPLVDANSYISVEMESMGYALNIGPAVQAALNSTSNTSKDVNDSRRSSMSIPTARRGSLMLSPDRVPFITEKDFEMTIEHTKAFAILYLAHLVSEYGSLLFAPNDLSAFVNNIFLHEYFLAGKPRVSSRDRHDKKKKSKDFIEVKKKEVIANEQIEEKEEDSSSSDSEDESNTEDKELLLFTVASREIHLSIENLVDAYDLWNSVSAQLIESEVVRAATKDQTSQNTGLTSADVSTSSNNNKHTSNVALQQDSFASIVSTTSTLSVTNSQGMVFLRPRLIHQIEPHPDGILISSKAKKLNDTSNSTGIAPSNTNTELAQTRGGATFQTARIRQVSIDQIQKLTKAVDDLHGMVKTCRDRFLDYLIAQQQIREFQQMEWQKAAELARSAYMVNGDSLLNKHAIGIRHANTHGVPSLAAATAAVIATAALPVDDRKHLYEWISFEHSTIQRLFQLEEEPTEELVKVRKLLEKKKELTRTLYSKHVPSMYYAVTLEELWHSIKILKLPKETHILPAIRDDFADSLLINSSISNGNGGEGMTNYGYEHVLSTLDLTELVLHLCNEQFPKISTLSGRVEVFLNNHLPFALQHQSVLKEMMQRAEVKKILADNSPLLRSIFRRYCSKEKDPKHKSRSSTIKYMRLHDWLHFIEEYELLNARLTLERALGIFRTIQQCEVGREENIRMIYSEFCEAVVALSEYLFPDPFTKNEVKLSKMIRKYLPVTPESTVKIVVCTSTGTDEDEK